MMSFRGGYAEGMAHARTCGHADGAQRAQHGLPDAVLDGAVVTNITGAVSDDLHDGVLVECPGGLQRFTQITALGHPLVGNAMRPAHACTCEHCPSRCGRPTSTVLPSA